MLGVAHLGYTVGAAWLVEKLRSDEPRLDYRGVAAAAIAANVIDRALFVFVLPRASSGRLIAHTLGQEHSSYRRRTRCQPRQGCPRAGGCFEKGDPRSIYTNGIVFRFFQLMPTSTVLENVMMPMRYGGPYEGQGRERAMEVLELVKVPGGPPTTTPARSRAASSRERRSVVGWRTTPSYSWAMGRRVTWTRAFRGVRAGEQGDSHGDARPRACRPDSKNQRGAWREACRPWGV